MVLEHCELDLYDLMKNQSKYYTLTQKDKLSISKQILNGVKYLH
jgi:serine/threonine protein kinase